ALNFRLGVRHGVNGATISFVTCCRAFAEIHPSQQFTHDHDVSSAHLFGPQGRQRFQLWQADRRPQVGKYAEFLPQPQKPRLRTKLRGILIESRPANSTEQYCVGGKTGLDGVRGQRIVAGDERRTSDGFLRYAQLVAKALRGRAQYGDGLRGNFRTDSISRKNCYVDEHNSPTSWTDNFTISRQCHPAQEKRRARRPSL